MDIICSLGECGETVIGSVTVLGDTTGELIWPGSIPSSHVYHGENEDGDHTTWIMLHPNCFKVLFDEMLRQEGTAAMTMIFGGVGEVKELLAMPSA